MPRGPAVLVVEDHIDLLSTMVHLLEDEGMDVTGMADGPSAVMMMRTGRAPDLVILDLDLPYVNGRDILAQLRSDETLKAIPVIVVTGSPEEVPQADAVLVKPADLKELLGLVYGLLGGAGVRTGGRHRKVAGG